MREKSRGRLRLASVTGRGESFMIAERIDIGVSPRERPHTRRHLVQEHAEREDIRPLVDRLPFRLLRRHISDCADDATVAGQHSRGHARFGHEARVFLQLGETEIEDLHAAVARDHDVGRLQIAMRDAALMRGADRVGERNREREQAVEWQAIVGDQIRKRLPIDELEREKRNAVDFLDRVDSDDVGVVQGGSRARLTLEAFAAVGVPGELTSQDLESHPALKSGVVSEVDLAHTTLSQ